MLLSNGQKSKKLIFDGNTTYFTEYIRKRLNSKTLMIRTFTLTWTTSYKLFLKLNNQANL